MGIAAALGTDPAIRLVGMVDSIVETRGILSEASCDVLLLNTDIPQRDAAGLLECWSPVPKQPRLIVLTGNESIDAVQSSFRLGVKGYGISRRVAPDGIPAAVRTVAHGQTWACPYTIELLLDVVLHASGASGAPWSGKPPISTRELDVLRLVANGAREPEIASRLCLSRNTVKTYRRRIRQKLQVETLAAAVRLAVDQKLLPTTAEALHADRPGESVTLVGSGARMNRIG